MWLSQTPIAHVGLLVPLFSPPSTEVGKELMAILHSLLNLFSRVYLVPSVQGNRGNRMGHSSPGCLFLSVQPVGEDLDKARSLVKAACCPPNPSYGPVSIDNVNPNNSLFQESFSSLTHWHSNNRRRHLRNGKPCPWSHMCFLHKWYRKKSASVNDCQK